MDPAVDKVLASLHKSRRYGSLYEPLLRRIAVESLEIENGKIRPAAKRAKRRLHQVFGAYLPQRPRYSRLLGELETVVAAGDDRAVRDLLRHVMGQHASTRERLPILDDFYREIFDRLGSVSSLADVACGLNPLAVPWMDLPPGCRYLAVDIDTAMVEFVAACLELLGVDHETRVADVLTEEVPFEADAALLLKSVPCLDQLRNDGGRSVIERLRARRIVVSFPTRSIGGRAKGMRDTYADRFEATADEAGWSLLERVEFPGELVYIVATGS